MSHKKQCNVLLRIDNTTAVAYINRMRNSRFDNLSDITKQIWDWCEARDIWIVAGYIASEENIEADYESRKLQPETEFELADYAFQKIVKVIGEPRIDLLASRTNTKCERYISWRQLTVYFQAEP